MLSGEEIHHRANAIHCQWTRIAARAYCDLHPEAWNSHWEDGEASAVFAGEGNPLTQAYGLGVGDGSPEGRLDAVAEFFKGRASKWELILTPFEKPEVWNLAVDRGLRFDHFENMLYRKLDHFDPPPELPREMKVEVVPESEALAWGDLCIKGFTGGEWPPFGDDLMHLLATAPHAVKFWGRWQGELASAASYSAYEDTVFLGGMGTLVEFRGRGFQQALLDFRLRHAAKRAQIALVEALPGTSSHRNIERNGFQVAFTSAVMVYDSSAGK